MPGRHGRLEAARGPGTADRVSATPAGLGRFIHSAITPRRAIASKLNTITRTSAHRLVTRTQSATRSSRLTRRHAVTRRTTPTRSAEPGMDKTKNKAINWASAP